MTLKIPFIHITDLYHPPQNPDDHIDLATVMALPELDLRGVILDTTTRFLHASLKGWRFVAGSGSSLSGWPMFLDPITATARDDGQVEWQSTVDATSYRIFRRQPGRQYGVAMAEALHALLQSLRC